MKKFRAIALALRARDVQRLGNLAIRQRSTLSILGAARETNDIVIRTPATVFPAMKVVPAATSSAAEAAEARSNTVRSR